MERRGIRDELRACSRIPFTLHPGYSAALSAVLGATHASPRQTWRTRRRPAESVWRPYFGYNKGAIRGVFPRFWCEIVQKSTQLGAFLRGFFVLVRSRVSRGIWPGGRSGAEKKRQNQGISTALMQFQGPRSGISRLHSVHSVQFPGVGS